MYQMYYIIMIYVLLTTKMFFLTLCYYCTYTYVSQIIITKYSVSYFDVLYGVKQGDTISLLSLIYVLITKPVKLRS